MSTQFVIQAVSFEALANLLKFWDHFNNYIHCDKVSDISGNLDSGL